METYILRAKAYDLKNSLTPYLGNTLTYYDKALNDYRSVIEFFDLENSKIFKKIIKNPSYASEARLIIDAYDDIIALKINLTNLYSKKFDVDVCEDIKERCRFTSEFFSDDSECNFYIDECVKRGRSWEK